MKGILQTSILLIILAICVGAILITSSQLYMTFQSLKLAEQQIAEQNQTIQTQSQTIQTQQTNINNLQNQVQQQRNQINELNSKVTSLQTQVESLTYELGQTTTQLEETTRLLNIAENYEERVKQGIYLSQAYKLLGDYDKTVDIVKTFTSVSTPSNDQELWDRARDIYYWLGNNYQYCSDKGLCVEGYGCTQIQFFSPDELLYYGSQDVLCGDCDDQAQLFAGMMYASGVPHNKVRVECGSVPGGYHCWNGIYVGSNWYRIDPVCASPSIYIPFFGWTITLTPFPTSHQDVDCFSSYTLTSWYNPEGYHTV